MWEGGQGVVLVLVVDETPPSAYSPEQLVHTQHW